MEFRPQLLLALAQALGHAARSARPKGVVKDIDLAFACKACMVVVE